ncbi:hypothetical protein HanXRQr2_Chr15g0713731 [Helianthus annuus]|uniref:Uncharacterized protein n=1 Tax=Helianthus annuus TaxID=4232 RepID=A0A9K3E3D1_HELAN|nr:hypothetical protein HanXRQr2_Chr15g0713721 [Helianthus annuus]KAF5766298.1 hypothetical protein HanXRQr2_Chr15g0713731 [Helianthus annuus]KAJ0832976.1 hypothetical protein HanPSC8_Chr15g0684921 [Helianthus annuus]KAJ0832977.1 hypothetical protein HanPSC8_Chr15g0684931 [Helianthus annuus]
MAATPFEVSLVQSTHTFQSSCTLKAGTCWLEGASGHGCSRDILSDFYLLCLFG